MRTLLKELHCNWETLQRFLESSPKHREQYQRARKDAIEMYVADIVPMSDAVIGEDMHVVTATRNAVEARKWVAGKLAPKEYGDAPSGVVINNQTNVMVMTDERLAALQAARRKIMDAAKQHQPPTLEA